MQLPYTCWLTPTCGRHHFVERCLRCFLDQDYEGKHLMIIYNNSAVTQTLSRLTLPEHKRVILINNHQNYKTQQPYKTLGEIYSDLLKLIPEEVEVVVHGDDDDTYLPSHLREGVRGYLEARSLGKQAYKPAYSLYRDAVGVHRVKNTLEPSIFVSREHLREWGYKDTTHDQHLSWIQPLLHDNILVDECGVSTFIYHWCGEPVFKTSGDPHNTENFQNYHRFSQDHGDGVLTPLSPEEIIPFYQCTLK